MLVGLYLKISDSGHTRSDGLGLLSLGPTQPKMPSPSQSLNQILGKSLGVNDCLKGHLLEDQSLIQITVENRGHQGHLVRKGLKVLLVPLDPQETQL